MIIDFHTHAFADSLAMKAIAALEEGCDMQAHLDGTVASLLHSMDKAGIDKAVVCSIATKPKQFLPILEWSKTIASERIIPLPSIHPESPDLPGKVRMCCEEGFKGIKLHPYYQDFSIDDEALFPVYVEAQRLGMLIVMHSGFDIAFPNDRIADPEKIAKIKEYFPGLQFVATHLGGWDDWHEVKKHIMGKPIYMETSFALERLPQAEVSHILRHHHPDFLFFGTDSPWTDQSNALALLYSLHLEQGLLDKILYKNAAALLGI